MYRRYRPHHVCVSTNPFAYIIFLLNLVWLNQHQHCCWYVRSCVEVYCTFLDSVLHKIRWHNRKPHQIFSFIEYKRFLYTAFTVIFCFISLFPAMQPELPWSLFFWGKSGRGVKLVTRPLILRLRKMELYRDASLYTLMVFKGTALPLYGTQR